MGRTVIVSHYHPFNLSLCAKLSRRFNDCRIIGAPDPDKKYLASQSELGLILELGPVANGIVEPAALEGSLELVDYLLELLNDEDFVPENKLEMYEESQDIYYPKNDRGEINAYIHSGFQGKDFSVQRGSFTPFRTFQGQEIQLFADRELYPIFINEAAYYPQQLAFTLCRKRMLNF
jgi:aspartoacylase